MQYATGIPDVQLEQQNFELSVGHDFLAPYFSEIPSMQSMLLREIPLVCRILDIERC